MKLSAFAALPLIVIPWYIDQRLATHVEQTLKGWLQVDGSVEDVHWLTTDGLHLEGGHFESADQSLSWRSIHSHADWSALYQHGTSALETHAVTIRGLNYRGPMRISNESTSLRLAPLPPLTIEDAEIELSSATQSWRLHISKLSVDSEAPAFPPPFDFLRGTAQGSCSIKLLGAAWEGEFAWSAPTPTQSGSLRFELLPSNDDSELPNPIPWRVALQRLSVRADASPVGANHPGANANDAAPQWQGNAKLEIDRLAVGTTRIEQLEVDGIWQQGAFRWQLPPTTLASGEFQARGQIDLGQDSWNTLFTTSRTMTLTPQLVFVLARISPIFVLTQATPETAICDFDLQGQARGQCNEIDTATGLLRLDISDGSVLVPEKARPLAAMVTDEALQHLPFQAFGTDIHLRDGGLHSDFTWVAHRTHLQVSGFTRWDGALHYDFRLKQLLDPDGQPRVALTPFLRLLETDPLCLRGSVMQPQLDLPLLGQSPWLSNAVQKLIHLKDMFGGKREN